MPSGPSSWAGSAHGEGHYSPWNFDTYWDMSCQGPVVTKYIPGYGVVTLTFRRLVHVPG